MILPADIKLVSINKPSTDKREYIGLQCSNGLRIVLISDIKADKSAVALNVGVGAMHENKEYNGVAHLVEHMIYMGSEKYPAHDSFSKYMENHGGSSNAYTDEKSTVYIFDISPNYFNGAFDLFAHAFIKPLFTDSALNSEINAVNQEHEKNLAADPWRYRQLVISILDQTHPIARFFTGNTNTLKTLPEQNNISSSFLVRDFYNRMYSSNLMNLVVLSNESIQDLIDLVVPLMNQIPNKNIILSDVPPDPFGSQGRRKLIKFVPVKESHHVSILWTIPSTISHYKATPFRVLSKILQGSQEGSLLAHLQQIGWVESFNFYELLSVPGCSIAEATFSLSSSGIEHWQEVVYQMFQYLNLYRSGIENWRFEEYQKIFLTNFEHSEMITPWNYVSNIADEMPLYNLEDCISGNDVMYEIRPDLVQNIIDSLTPGNCSIFVCSSTFKNITDKSEYWYGTKYKAESLSDDLIKSWENCGVSPLFYKPDRNNYIPEKFDIITYNEFDSNPLPELIMESEYIRLWYKRDRDFNRPKAYVFMSIVSTDRYWDKHIAVAYNIYWHLLNMELRRELAQARRCKYVLEIKSMIDSATVAFGGYDDKLDILCEKVVQNLFQLNFNKNEFDMAKDADIRDYRNERKQKQPRMAVQEFGYLMRRRRFTYEEMLPLAEALTFERFKQIMDQVMRHISIDTLIFGNIHKEKSIKIANLIQDTLLKLRPMSIPLTYADRHILKETHLPAGSAHVRTVENLAHPANAILSRYQIAPYTLPKYVYGMLFVEMFEEHFFDILRTNEHLGYIAMLDFSILKQSYFISVFVQSDKNVNFVQSRMDTLMGSVGSTLRDMEDSEFEEHVESLSSRMSEKPKNMYEQGLRWFDELNKMEIIFDRRDQVVNILKNVKKTDIIQFYEDYLAPYSVERRKLTVHVKPHKSVMLQLNADYNELHENDNVDMISINQTEIVNVKEWLESMPVIGY